MGPIAAAVFGAVYYLGESKGQRPRIVLPKSPPELDHFCEVSGLKFLASQSPASSNTDCPDLEVVALERFEESRWNQSDPVVHLVRRHREISEDTEDYLRICINEVVQNVIDHSKSVFGGVMCSRYMSNRDRVHVAIVDHGKGIFETLHPAHPEIGNSIEALRAVIRGRYSAKSRENNMGLGISNLWGVVRELEGRIAIMSGGARARYTGGGTSDSFETLEFSFPGTFVWFSLPMA